MTSPLPNSRMVFPSPTLARNSFGSNGGLVLPAMSIFGPRQRAFWSFRLKPRQKTDRTERPSTLRIGAPFSASTQMSVGTDGRNTHLRLYHGVKPTGRFAFRTLEDSDFLTGLVRLNANEPHRLAAPQARKNSKLGPAVQWVWLNRCHLPGGSATDLSVADNCLSGAAMEPFSLTHRGGPGQDSEFGSRGVVGQHCSLKGRSQEDPPALYLIWIGGGTSSPGQ
jgi:hypothetical protein